MKTMMIFPVFLAGCAAAPVAPPVAVPVYLPCVKSVPVRPAYEFGKLTVAAGDGEKILALARDYPRGRKYEGELEAVIEGCNVAQPSPPTAQKQ
ncbi:hypothetical protein AAKU55_004901 [Oxalobacteraceae bacterium GrIS 1.11]